MITKSNDLLDSTVEKVYLCIVDAQHKIFLFQKGAIIIIYFNKSDKISGLK